MFFILVYLVLNLLLVWHDLRSGLLPDRFTCPLLWAGLLWHCFWRTELLAQAVIGAAAGYIGFAFLYWGYRGIRGQEGLGYGDVKYLAALGAWHGWQILPGLVFIAALLACITALCKAIGLRNRQALKNPLPFGPFLAAAGLLTGSHTVLTTLPL
ncbi:A24 family peptidase [Enterobacter sp. Bisph1]|uniref:prepilin peptidase n=1 Tax=Enterobacter sp. Bisph1 TaxID=1274399 RepID=UPI00057BFC98|nr:A24 family peptidase [Enterobacter sp. Bisph1]